MPLLSRKRKVLRHSSGEVTQNDQNTQGDEINLEENENIEHLDNLVKVAKHSPMFVPQNRINLQENSNPSEQQTNGFKTREKLTPKRNRSFVSKTTENKRRKKEGTIDKQKNYEIDAMIESDIIPTNSLFDFEDLHSLNTAEENFTQLKEHNFPKTTNPYGVDFDNPSSQFTQYSQDYQASLRQIVENNSVEVKNSDNGDIGHIQAITLQNFMCHSNFHLDLGPRVNFIVGQNGSGKSAILNGIVLGLGGRASTTNRGSGLSTFIKNGESKAKIVIKLSNYINGQTKEHSYMYDTYGKSIIIERTININGQSSYKIKSEKGKTISERKEELDNILKHHCIYIDNPICVLTQEVSKNFLNSKNASDKFKFFVKATQIEDTKKDYETSNINYLNSLKLIEEKEELLKSHKNKLEEYRQKVEIIEILRNSVTKIQSLNDEALWAIIKENEKKLEGLESEFNEHKNKIDNCIKEIEKVNQKISKVKDQKEELDNKKKNFGSEIKKSCEELQEAKEKSCFIRKQLTEKETKLTGMKKDLNFHLKEINDLKKRINGIETNSQEGEQIDIGTMIENIIEKIESKKSEEVELKRKIEQLQKNNEEHIKERIHLTEEERKISAQISSYSIEMERLSRSEKNRLGRYGSKFPDLNASIETLYKQKKFKHKPLGPIGEYIRLEDNSSALAVECCLKTLLFAYVVDNGDDARVLKNLVGRLFVNQKPPTIIIRKFTRLHDVSSKQVKSPHYKNFLQLLNIKEENDPVANCLIDHCRIEQILYIPDFKEAQHMLLRQDLVPKNCAIAYTSGGDLMYPSNNRGDYKCYPNKRYKFAKILVQDRVKTKENYMRSIEDLKEKQFKLYEKSKETCQLIDENKKTINNINHQINTINMEQINMETRLAELKAKASIKPVEMQALKEEMEKLQEERDNLKNQIDGLTEERQKLSEEYMELVKEVDEKDQAYNTMINSGDQITKEINKLKEQNSNLTQKIQFLEKEKEKLLEVIHNYEKKITELKEEINQNEQSALARTNNTRIETDRTIQQIMKEIKRIEIVINKNQDIIDLNEQKQILTQFQQLQTSIKRVKNDLDHLNKYFLMFQKSLQQRKKAYLKMRLYITNIINYYFFNFLKQKEFQGQISVYFHDFEDPENDIKKKAKTLEIEIKPGNREFASQQNSQNEVHSYSSTKSLSGGERSFSTVAFIIALWEICKSPFKILDEIDVFMDMVTRKISLDTLVEFAVVKSNKQYIFLSPLQIQQFSHTNYVKIFKMPTPQRI